MRVLDGRRDELWRYLQRARAWAARSTTRCPLHLQECFALPGLPRRATSRSRSAPAREVLSLPDLPGADEARSAPRWPRRCAASSGREVAGGAERRLFVAAHNGARDLGRRRAGDRAAPGGPAGARAPASLLYCNRRRWPSGRRRLGVPAESCAVGGDVALPHALRFAARLRRDRPDALLLGTFKKLFLAALGARLAGVPRVVARVGLETRHARAPPSTASRCRAGSTPWWSTRSAMRAPFAELPGFGAARVTVIHNGVQAARRADAAPAARARSACPPDAPVVGAVARLAVQKRLDRLLHALAACAASVHCVIAGEGAERAALEALAAARGLRGASTSSATATTWATSSARSTCWWSPPTARG